MEVKFESLSLEKRIKATDKALTALEKEHYGKNVYFGPSNVMYAMRKFNVYTSYPASVRKILDAIFSVGELEDVLVPVERDLKSGKKEYLERYYRHRNFD